MGTMSNTDFETGVCQHCREGKERHLMMGGELTCRLGIVQNFKDSGLQQVEDNAVRVLRAAIALLNEIVPPSKTGKAYFTKAILRDSDLLKELKSACEASTKRE